MSHNHLEVSADFLIMTEKIEDKGSDMNLRKTSKGDDQNTEDKE